MIMNKFLDVNPEVAEAIANGKPVVALESTIISHGMPYPQNVETALAVEQIIRENSHLAVESKQGVSSLLNEVETLQTISRQIN